MALVRNGTWGALSTAVTTGTLTVALPVHAVGNLLVVAIVGKQYDAALTTPAGWTQRGATFTSGTTLAGTDVGSLQVRFYTLVATSATTTSPAFTMSGGTSAANIIAGAAIALTSDVAGSTYEVVTTSGADATTDVNLSCTGSLIAITNDDVVLACMGSPSDAGTWNTNQELTAAGVTWVVGSAATPAAGGNEFATGGQLSVFYRYRKVATGTATAGPNYALTATASGAWAQGLSGFMRVREVVSHTRSGSDNAGASDTARAVADPYGIEVRADSPTSWWRLDEATGTTAQDHTGWRDGTYAAGVTRRPALPRLGNGSAGFDGQTATTVTVPRVTFPVASWSIECWVKTSGVPGTPGSETERYIYNNGISLRIRPVQQIMFAGHKDQNGNLLTEFANMSGNDNIAHHLVATYNGTTIRMYVDGVEQRNAPLATPTSLVYDDVTTPLGQGNQFVTGPFLGDLDEVAVYSTVLSPARIMAHYTAGAPPVARSADDSAGATDAGVASATVPRSAEDGAGAADAGAQVLGGVRTDDELSGTTDSGSAVLGVAQEAQDSAGVSDALSGVLARAVDDPAGAADVGAGLSAAARVADDDAGAADALSGVLSRAAQEPAGAADAGAGVLAVMRSADESAGVADAGEYEATGANAQADDEPAGAADAGSTVLTSARSTDDAAGAADALSATLSRPASDQAGSVDEASWSSFAVRSALDDAGSSDAGAYQASGDVTVMASTSTGVADSGEAVVNVGRLASDDAGAADDGSATFISARQGDDRVGLVDQAARVLSVTQAGTDDLGAADAGTASISMSVRLSAADDAGARDEGVYTSLRRNITAEAGPPRRADRSARPVQTARGVSAPRTPRTAGAPGGLGRTATPARDD